MRPFRLLTLSDLEILTTEFDGFSLYFSTRKAGFSKPPFDTLNLSFEVGDKPEAVVKNRKKLAEVLGVAVESFMTLRQKHSSKVLKVGRKNRGSFLSNEVCGCGDALVTSEPGALTLFFADCLPIYLLEPEKRVAGLIHAGWRGLKSGIVKKTVEKMVSEFGILPQSLFAWLGPSIGPCCYQVSSDFLSYFRAYPGSFRKTIDGQIFFNLKSIGHAQLLEAGVKKNNIVTSYYCTFCQADLFFSYRRERGKTGRQAAILVVKGK